MRRWLIALGFLLLITGAGLYKAARSTPWPEPIQSLVTDDKQTLGYLITTGGSDERTPYVSREADLQRVPAEELKRRLLNAFKLDDGWDWAFARDDKLKRTDWTFFAHANRGDDVVQVQILKGESPTIVWDRNATHVQVFIERIRNPGRDPFDDLGN